jgi:hypothetical protein
VKWNANSTSWSVGSIDDEDIIASQQYNIQYRLAILEQKLEELDRLEKLILEQLKNVEAKIYNED